MIVKPEGGSQGDGIFLVQNASDLRLKLDAKPHFGAGFGALAQRYLPDPLLLDGLKLYFSLVRGCLLFLHTLHPPWITIRTNDIAINVFAP